MAEGASTESYIVDKLLPEEALFFGALARHKLLHPVKNRPHVMDREVHFTESMLLARRKIAETR